MILLYNQKETNTNTFKFKEIFIVIYVNDIARHFFGSINAKSGISVGAIISWEYVEAMKMESVESDFIFLGRSEAKVIESDEN